MIGVRRLRTGRQRARQIGLLAMAEELDLGHEAIGADVEVRVVDRHALDIEVGALEQQEGRARLDLEALGELGVGRNRRGGLLHAKGLNAAVCLDQRDDLRRPHLLGNVGRQPLRQPLRQVCPAEGDRAGRPHATP